MKEQLSAYTEINGSALTLEKSVPETQAVWTKNYDKVVRLDLTKKKKETTSATEYQQLLKRVLNSLTPTRTIFTDGPKHQDGCGFALVDNNDVLYTIRLRSDVSIFYAEASAVLKSIIILGNSNGKTAIVTDSLSTLQAVKNPRNSNPTIVKIRNALKPNITLIWCPSHKGIPLNERADFYANQAAQKTAIDQDEINSQDAWNAARTSLRFRVESEWAAVTLSNKLRTIQDTWTEDKSIHKHLTRKQSTALTRLRIGHTRTSHDYVFNREEPPICESCNTSNTTQHFLTECTRFTEARRNNNIRGNLSNILKMNAENIDRLMKFLLETEHHDKL